jgi:glucose-6-phosphate dehydrogenase assembly protein OpcA
VLANRRISDCALADDPLVALRKRAEDFAPGDTDLAWSRTTPWRALLASAVDAVSVTPKSARVGCEPGNPSAALLQGWLRSRLNVGVELVDTAGPGITEAAIDGERAGGTSYDVQIARPDGRTATLSRSGEPDRQLPLARREVGDLLAEELRRMDPDYVYAEALSAATGVTGLDERSPNRTHVWRDPAWSETG